MANRRWNATALAKRRYDVAKMNRAGLTLAEIGEILDVDASTVCRDLEWVRQEWLKEKKVEDFDQARAIELAKLNLVERYLWDAFERSKEDKVTRKCASPPTGSSDGRNERPNRASPRE